MDKSIGNLMYDSLLSRASIEGVPVSDSAKEVIRILCDGFDKLFEIGKPRTEIPKVYRDAFGERGYL